MIRLRLDIILERKQYLEDIVNQGIDAYYESPHIRAAAERYIQTIAQAVTDIATHIVATEHLGTPESYSDAIMRVATHNIIPLDLAERLVRLIKMRNVIVHLYTKIDPTIVFQGATQALSDLAEFVTIMQRFLQE